MIFQVNDLVRLRGMQSQKLRPEVYEWVGFVTRIETHLPLNNQMITVLWPQNGEEECWASDSLEVVNEDE